MDLENLQKENESLVSEEKQLRAELYDVKSKLLAEYENKISILENSIATTKASIERENTYFNNSELGQQHARENETNEIFRNAKITK